MAELGHFETISPARRVAALEGQIAAMQGTPVPIRKSNPDIFVMQSAEDRVAKIRPALFTVRDKGASLSRVPGRTRPFRRRRQGPPQRHPSLRLRIR